MRPSHDARTDRQDDGYGGSVAVDPVTLEAVPLDPATRDLDRPHPLDLVSLVAGLVTVLLAGLYLLADLTTVQVGPLAVAAVVVCTVGAGTVALGVRRLASR